MNTTAAAQMPVPRMPSLRRFDVDAYDKVERAVTDSLGRLESARQRYMDVREQFATLPAEARPKLVAVARKKLEIDQVRSALRSDLDKVSAQLEAAKQAQQQTVVNVDADTARAFTELPRQADELNRQVGEFEGLVNDLLSGLQLSAAEETVEVSPDIAGRAPKSWTDEDLQLLERFRRAARRVMSASSAVEAFYRAIDKPPARPWSSALSDEVRLFFDMLERGKAREILAELAGMRPVIEEALTADQGLNQPLSPETKQAMAEYTSRTTPFTEVGDRAQELLEEIEREGLPVSQWPEAIAYEQARRRLEQAERDLAAGDTTQEVVDGLRKELEKAKLTYEDVTETRT